MDQPERQDSYRTVRILIDQTSAQGLAPVSVVARSSHRGTHRDRLLLRRYLNVPVDSTSVATLLRSAADVLFAAAKDLDDPPRSGRSPLEGTTGESHGDVRSRGITVDNVGPGRSAC
jgi:hypothetical protein